MSEHVARDVEGLDARRPTVAGPESPTGDRQPAPGLSAAPQHERRSAELTAGRLLRLQRTAGNAAVAGLFPASTPASGEAVGALGPDAVIGGEVDTGLDPEAAVRDGTEAGARPEAPEQPGVAPEPVGTNPGLSSSLVAQEAAHAGARPVHGPPTPRPSAPAPRGVRGMVAQAVDRARGGLSVQRCGRASATVPTLAKTTVSGPTAHPFGSFSWGSRWSINNGAGANGFVVQHVRWVFDVKDAANAAVDAPARLGIDPAWTDFSEAWQVRNGAVFVGTTTSPHSADTYANPGLGDGTKGSLSILGTADYHAIPSLPSSFAVRNAAPAWALPVVAGDAGLPGGTGALQHNITATWDCTPTSTDRTTRITTV
ncbi:hypothetical protein Cch01nite_32140 [Cellulomonas chitinilytica]|uniref:Uncharacterized protein n=1 Tax=Cellulomonas chitinilytica TaxID=398759 RepID=A0A919U059_9CELL|nr:hypothetical protein [Cellulomonas chitinilytica]GIG22490.1 hypothetical protein Cch01nite_32140 [Cellulomonas chitinilytica]